MARGLDRATRAIMAEKMENLRQAIDGGQPRHERTFGYIHNCYSNGKLNRSGKPCTIKDNVKK
jgi:hypothetical protein